MNPWHKENGPLWLLAPMEDVTDTVFRRVIRQASGPAPVVFYTEFASTDGLTHEYAHDKVAHRLRYTEVERPLVAQIWGKNPAHYREVAAEIVRLGFDGIDINMGCPVKKIIKQGSCSALIKNPTLASEIIRAVQEGVAGQIPVSVKTRIGFDSIVTEEWCSHLLSHQLAALIVHGRTTRELSKFPCHWDEIAKVPGLRDELAPDTLVIGNGDVVSREHGEKLIARTKVDGIMVGRGIFKNPWFFHPDYTLDSQGQVLRSGTLVQPKQRLELFLTHLTLWQETYAAGARHHYPSLRKFAKVYLQGFAGASSLRQEFMRTTQVEAGVALLQAALASIEADE